MTTRFWINEHDLSEYVWHVVRTPGNHVLVTGTLSAPVPSIALMNAVGTEAVITIASGTLRATLFSIDESVAVFSINEQEARSAD